MELSRRDFRAMIYYEYKKDYSPENVFNFWLLRLVSLLVQATVFNRFTELKGERESFDNEARAGQPPATVTEENAQALEELIRENRRTAYVARVETEYLISSGANNCS
ncbi:hypothetical protein EVAR_30471_1 [Eumeta japonica]|uniref:Uncharacterized protein n=1 Tax=Eumeta variegata TaxID=151549 RepID=A0A4C1W023_EUMVA|nr:hypothetical protein EVAR_30471_1 [Eumeta japonica]